MKLIHPYSSFAEAIESFDNGGKFFNLFSHAKDGVVSPAELGKVAGVTNDKQSLILYFVLSISRLENQAREKVLARLDMELFKLYEKYQPIHMSVEQISERGKAGMSITLVGTPKKISTDVKFSGSILTPLLLGSVPSFVEVPLTNSYEVYELKSDYSEASVMVAHPKETELLPERKLRLGGFLTSVSESDNVTHPEKVFLDVQYYLEEN